MDTNDLGNMMDFPQIPHMYRPFHDYNVGSNNAASPYLYPPKNQENLQSSFTFREMDQSKRAVIAKRYGDIDGDGIMDIVLLTGNKTSDSPLWRNLSLIIQNGRTNQFQQVPLRDNNIGYNPTLFLGDFTGDKLDDILVVIDTGGSSGAIYAYIYSDRQGWLKQIFNSNEFNDAYKYQVSYQNQYRTMLISDFLKEKYMLDLTYKGKEYLSEIYNPNGILKEPIEGWVNPLSGLYPVDFNRDGTYELVAYQRIVGRYNADSLGFVLTVLKWNGQVFSVDRQNVSIFGGKI